MDLQYILDPYACVMYMAAYMLKSEQSMGELLKQVSIFLNHREVSAQEAVSVIATQTNEQESHLYQHSCQGRQSIPTETY